MTSAAWFGLTLAVMLADWVAVQRGLPRLHRLAKPGAMLALFAWLWQAGGWQGNLPWFGLAVFFSLLGDVFLLLPPRYFLAGLGAFLLAHLTYIAGFFSDLHTFSLPGAAILALLVLGLGATVYPRIRAGLCRRSHGRKFRGAVLAYCLAIAAMLFSAGLTLLRPEWPRPAAALAAAGAAFFFVSDTLLAYDRFVRAVQNARLWVMITYHLGQLGLVGAAIACITLR